MYRWTKGRRKWRHVALMALGALLLNAFTQAACCTSFLPTVEGDLYGQETLESSNHGSVHVTHHSTHHPGHSSSEHAPSHAMPDGTMPDGAMAKSDGGHNHHHGDGEEGHTCDCLDGVCGQASSFVASSDVAFAGLDIIRDFSSSSYDDFHAAPLPGVFRARAPPAGLI